MESGANNEPLEPPKELRREDADWPNEANADVHAVGVDETVKPKRCNKAPRREQQYTIEHRYADQHLGCYGFERCKKGRNALDHEQFPL